MPLDSQAAAILEAMSDGGVDLNPDTPPQVMRDGMEQGSMLMEKEDVALVEDRIIPGPASNPGGELKVRIYNPNPPGVGKGDSEGNESGDGAGDSGGNAAGEKGAAGGVVFFHGGGWVVGSIDTHDGQVRTMVNKTGLVVVSVDYRLAPEDPFPAAPEDCYAAVSWVAENAAELGIDPKRLAVAGDSAGGNLAAVVSQMAKERGGPELCFQLLVYPVCDLEPSLYPSMTENEQGPFLTRALMEYFYRHYMGDHDPADPMAAPIRAEDLSGLPPALVITAEMDPLRDEGEAYYKRLKDAGVVAEYICYDGMFHGFFGFGAFIDRAAQAQEDVAKRLIAAV